MGRCRVLMTAARTQFPTSMRRPIGCAWLEGNHYYRDEWLQSSPTIDDAEGNRGNRGQHGFGRDTNLSV